MSEGLPRQRVVAVIGPGRSGTSVTTRAVAALGVALGDRLKPATRKNARGFFEDEDLLAVNYALRAHFGMRRSGATVRPVRPEELTGPVVEALARRAVDVIRARFAGHPVWGFKSGGTAAFLPFWEDVFARAEQQPSYVLALRHPLAVARSRARLGGFRGVPERSDLEWLVRIVPHFRRAARHPLVVVEFDRLLAHPERELERIALHLELPTSERTREEMRRFAAEFLDPELRHERVTPEEQSGANPLACEAYELLHAVAIDATHLDAPEFDAAWGRVEELFEATVPLLRHLEQEEQSRRWSVPDAVRALRRELPRLRSAPPPRRSA